MAVGIQREGDILVPEAFLHDLGVDALAQEQSGVGMTEVDPNTRSNQILKNSNMNSPGQISSGLIAFTT